MIMDISPQERTHHTRLRDFGAFQVDVSALNTQKVAIASMTPFPMPLTSVSRDQQREENHLPVVEVRKIAPKKWIKLAIRLTFTTILLVLLLQSLSWTTLLTMLTHVRHGIILVAVVVGASGVVLSAYQWRSLLRAQHIRIDLADLINLYMVGVAFSHFLPTGMGGDAVKALHVGREANNSAGSACAVVMCRVTGFCGMLLVALPVLLIWHEQFPSGLMTWFALLSLLVSVMMGGTFLSAILLPRWFKGRWARYRILASAVRIGQAIKMSASHPRTMGIAIAYGLAFWVIAILNCYCYADALGIAAPLTFYCVAVPLIALVSFLPISINGFGLRESAYVYVFAAVHTSSTMALLLALLLDAQALFFGAIGGCVYLTMGNKIKMAKLGKSKVRRQPSLPECEVSSQKHFSKIPPGMEVSGSGEQNLVSGGL